MDTINLLPKKLLSLVFKSELISFLYIQIWIGQNIVFSVLIIFLFPFEIYLKYKKKQQKWF